MNYTEIRTPELQSSENPQIIISVIFISFRKSLGLRK